MPRAKKKASKVSARRSTRSGSSSRARRVGRGQRLRQALRRWLMRVFVLGAVVVVAYAAWLDIHVRSQFEGRRWQVPARLYARALELYPGVRLTRTEVEAELKALGYRRDDRLSRAGSYRTRRGRIDVRSRRFLFWDGEEPARTLTVRFNQSAVRTLSDSQGVVTLARLEPQLIARIDPRHREDRLLVRLDDVPKSVVGALLAVEDRAYFEHSGVSLRAIARALIANLRAGATVQGGSTITQQLAKNYFLTPARSLWRKVNDIAIAIVLELHYDKEEILEAYLNEVYLGQQGQRAIHGFGLAAQFYFARPLEELDLAESALLVAMVRGASYYNPRRHPKRALARRNLVLAKMQETGLINEQQRRHASASELAITAEPGSLSARFTGFVDLVRRQLARDYAGDALQSEGLRIFTTLDPRIQTASQKALAQRLVQLDKIAKQQPNALQGATMVVAPQSGEVLALVAGRDDLPGGFNRALDARRQVGSLLKPVVYLSALGNPRYTLMTPVNDVPVKLKDSRNEVWAPSNYDGQAYGAVPLIEALSRSLNLATVNLGLEIGVDQVVKLLAQLGLDRPVKPYPSLLLGAVEMSPIEVTQVYQSFAAGGFRQPLRAIRDVTTADGAPLKRYPLEVAQVAPAASVFVLNRALQEVMRSGTGASAARRLAVAPRLAGKTGTTDELRDSWFAGFGADVLAVVWVGRDDNAPAGLTGSTGALAVWTDIMRAVGVEALSASAPEGVEWYGVDLLAALRFNVACEVTPVLPFVTGSTEPVTECGGVTTDLPRIRTVPGAGSVAPQYTEDGR